MLQAAGLQVHLPSPVDLGCKIRQDLRQLHFLIVWVFVASVQWLLRGRLPSLSLYLALMDRIAA